MNKRSCDDDEDDEFEWKIGENEIDDVCHEKGAYPGIE
jgi:hypothetical protein